MATTSEPGADGPVRPEVHVALLRGINVGGNNKLPMADLRAILADLGLGEVRTYLNTGNALFTCTPTDHVLLAERIESATEDAVGFRPRVLVRSGEDIRAIAASLPSGWTNDGTMKSDVVYLLDGVQPRDVLADLAPRDGVDHVVVAPGALAWMVARTDATRSGLLRLVATPHYARATVRNVNTARRLAALVEEQAGR